MARKSSLGSLEDQLRCPVCLDLFAEPLMLQCGHSYCRTCLHSMTLDPLGQLQCPVCRSEVDGVSLPPNVSLARVVDLLRELDCSGAEPECREHRNPLSLYCDEDQAVICGLCASIGDHRSHQITPIISVYSRMKEDISCLMTELQAQKRKLEEQISKMSHNKSRITNESDVLKWVIRKEFGELRRYLEEEEAGFMQTAESSAAALIASIQTQVDDMTLLLANFQEAEGTLEALSNESHLDFIRKYGSIAPRLRECQQKQQREERSYSAIAFKSGFNLSDIKLSVWKRLHRRVLPAPEQLKLDPLTAHPLLQLSQGDTAVECGVLPCRLPNNPERFSYSYCVTASRGFSGGKHLWEVGVAGKRKWRLGVIKGTVARKAKLLKSPEAGVWLIGLKEGGLYEAFSSPRVALPLAAPPATVAVFLDYEGGELSFFDAGSPQELSLLYRFRADFQGKLYPLFDVCWHERGANKQPITLRPTPNNPGPPPPAPPPANK